MQPTQACKLKAGVDWQGRPQKAEIGTRMQGSIAVGQAITSADTAGYLLVLGLVLGTFLLLFLRLDRQLCVTSTKRRQRIVSCYLVRMLLLAVRNATEIVSKLSRKLVWGHCVHCCTVRRPNHTVASTGGLFSGSGPCFYLQKPSKQKVANLGRRLAIHRREKPFWNRAAEGARACICTLVRTAVRFLPLASAFGGKTKRLHKRRLGSRPA